MKRLLLLLCVCLFSFQIWAQNRTVTGKIADENGNPLSGASVLVKGTQIGTVTDQSGHFSISVPANAKTFVISSVNFVENEVAISDNLSVTLKSVTGNLAEVVVVAYGTQKKSEITSAISTVSADAIKNQQVVSAGQALQGTAPGVVVVNANGQPGENPVIRIRGIASIAASADPLIVLDGIPYDGNLNMINPSDIDNFSILKDASATALYGSRAANGVILITTKSGKKNSATAITLSAVYGVSSRAIQ